MRNVLALVGAAVLTISMSAFSSPAAASDAGIHSGEDIRIDEVGVALDSLVAGGFVELESFHSTNVDLDDYLLMACGPTSSTPTLLVAFGPSDTIFADAKYLAANSNYAGGPVEDISFAGSADTFLDPDDGGIFLVDDQSGVLHAVEWGTPAVGCMPATAETAPTLTSSQSVERHDVNETWSRINPDPENSAS